MLVIIFDFKMSKSHFLKLEVGSYNCLISSIPWWTKKGITERKMLIYGSNYFAIAYKTSMFVNKIEI